MKAHTHTQREHARIIKTNGDTVTKGVLAFTANLQCLGVAKVHPWSRPTTSAMATQDQQSAGRRTLVCGGETDRKQESIQTKKEMAQNNKINARTKQKQNSSGVAHLQI